MEDPIEIQTYEQMSEEERDAIDTCKHIWEQCGLDIDSFSCFIYTDCVQISYIYDEGRARQVGLCYYSAGNEIRALYLAFIELISNLGKHGWITTTV